MENTNMLGNSEEMTGKIMDKADIAFIAHIDDEGQSQKQCWGRERKMA